MSLVKSLLNFELMHWCICFNSSSICMSFHSPRYSRPTVMKEEIPPVRWRKKKKLSSLGSPDVSYSLPAIKPDKEKAPRPSSASSLPRSLSPSRLFTENREGGIIQWLKRLKSSRGLELLRLPGAPEEGQTFTGKEKRGEKKKINRLPESCGVHGEWWCRALGEFVL